MLIIPLQPVPSQTVNALINNQATTLNVRQLNDQGLFMDVLLNDAPIIQGVICQNLNVIIRNAYFGYVGDFAFVDTQGTSDPVYTGLGSRYVLGYFTPAELPAGLA
jgi:hypothetical protein